MFDIEYELALLLEKAKENNTSEVKEDENQKKNVHYIKTKSSIKLIPLGRK